MAAAELAHVCDGYSLPPVQQRQLRDSDWLCPCCAGEDQITDDGQAHRAHSRACAVRYSDGSTPARWPAPGIMAEPEPIGTVMPLPVDKVPALPPVPPDRAGRIEWAKAARSAGWTYQSIADAVGVKQPQAWQWVNNPRWA